MSTKSVSFQIEIIIWQLKVRASNKYTDKLLQLEGKSQMHNEPSHINQRPIILADDLSYRSTMKWDTSRRKAGWFEHARTRIKRHLIAGRRRSSEEIEPRLKTTRTNNRIYSLLSHLTKPHTKQEWWRLVKGRLCKTHDFLAWSMQRKLIARKLTAVCSSRLSKQQKKSTYPE